MSLSLYIYIYICVYDMRNNYKDKSGQFEDEGFSANSWDRNLIDLGVCLISLGVTKFKETTSIFSTHFNRVSGVSRHMWHPFEDLEKLSAMVGEAGPRADGINTFGVIVPGNTFFSDLINE